MTSHSKHHISVHVFQKGCEQVGGHCLVLFGPWESRDASLYEVDENLGDIGKTLEIFTPQLLSILNGLSISTSGLIIWEQLERR